jgi:hypothetical protein
MIKKYSEFIGESTNQPSGVLIKVKFKDKDSYDNALKLLPTSKQYKDEDLTISFPYKKDLDWIATLVPSVSDIPNRGHQKVIDLLKPAGVLSFGMAPGENITKVDKIKAPTTFDDIKPYPGFSIINRTYEKELPNVDTHEVSFENIPNQLIINISEFIKENCVSNFDDVEEAEFFKKKFDLKRVFDDKDAHLIITLNDSKEKMYSFFIDSDTFRYCIEMNISPDGTQFWINDGF